MRFITFGHTVGEEEQSSSFRPLPTPNPTVQDDPAAKAVIASYKKFWAHGKSDLPKQSLVNIEPVKQPDCHVFKLTFIDGTVKEAKACRTKSGWLVSAYWTDKQGESTR